MRIFVVFVLSLVAACAVNRRPAPEAPQIEFWYGPHQTFGQRGDPQPLANVLGNIHPAAAIAQATVSLNGQGERPLALGVDLHRLAQPGDFNVEIDRNALVVGTNTVRVRATTKRGKVIDAAITVHYTAGQQWPLPYAIDWSQVANIQDVAEVIDGKWSLSPDGIRTQEPYYDRVIAMGDDSWRDYEVVLDVTFHRIMGQTNGRSLQGPPYLDHAHASVAMRWGGHPEDGQSPRREWQNIGGLAMFRADYGKEGAGHFWWLHMARKNQNPGPIGIFSDNRLKVEPEKAYRYRVRAETIAPKVSRYSMKAWPVGQSEPVEWDLVGEDVDENVAAGGLLLVVHHADVTFGNIRVEPL